MLDTGSYLSAIAADSAAIADMADGRLDRPVPRCPDWQVSDVLKHLGGIYSWVWLIIQAGGEQPDKDRDQPPADPAALVDWFREQRDAVVDTLESHDPTEPAWFFIPEVSQTVATWRRRQALETSIHLYDVQAAVGRPGPVVPDLAADGIDEMLITFFPMLLGYRGPVAGLEGTVHIHCTDDDLTVGGEWVLDFTGPLVKVSREHVKADTAVRGPASDLFLWAWNRIPLDSAGLEIFGRREVAEAMSEVKV